MATVMVELFRNGARDLGDGWVTHGEGKVVELKDSKKLRAGAVVTLAGDDDGAWTVYSVYRCKGKNHKRCFD
jgi:hypothetical protein